jgi:hypothetical protein
LLNQHWDLSTVLFDVYLKSLRTGPAIPDRRSLGLIKEPKANTDFRIPTPLMHIDWLLSIGHIHSRDEVLEAELRPGDDGDPSHHGPLSAVQTGLGSHCGYSGRRIVRDSILGFNGETAAVAIIWAERTLSH